MVLSGERVATSIPHILLQRKSPLVMLEVFTVAQEQGSRDEQRQRDMWVYIFQRAQEMRGLPLPTRMAH